MDDAEYDDDDVVDARASTSGNGVTVDTAHSPDHSDHSSLASVTDDEDSMGTDVRVRPRFYSPDHSDHSSLASLTYKREASTGTNVQVRSRSHSPDYSDHPSWASVTYDEDTIAEYNRRKKEEEEKKEKEKKEKEKKEKEKKEKEKKEKEKKERDKEFMKRMKKTFGQAGYDEETIEKISKMGMEQGHGQSINIKTRDLIRPAIVRVHRKHMSPETLNEYELPWEWDEHDSDYMAVKQWIPETDQEILFDHEKKLREKQKQTGGLEDLGDQLKQPAEESNRHGTRPRARP